MELTIHVPDEIKLQAEACGLGPESYVEQVVREELAKAGAIPSLASVRAAVDEIRKLRKRNRLDGLSVLDLVREGRKY